VEQFQKILLEVWREACRHIEIGESARAIAAILREYMPLERLAIHRLDAEHARVAIAAVVPDAGDVLPGSQALPASELKRIESWIREAKPMHLAAAHPPPAPLGPLKWPRFTADTVVAPLLGLHGPAGLTVLSAVEDQSFSAGQVALIEALQEPLAVALENDGRLHELNSLREAAEADRRSLLTRLGRKGLADEIVGEESGLKQVLQRVKQICRSDVPVLILGETGTGKELIARAIHNGSDRSAGPFIRVNCGAIPPELIDSQLFGHEKGSFTGATDSRPGWFERADKGTLFLDEIGELPPNAQVRFLRVLQDGFVERVGSDRPLHVDVRVVAATHRDLAAMVAENRFREDLWYRIAVFPIMLPPVRERKQDIPALVEHFAQRAATRFGLAPVAASPADIKLLQSYDWPGNIRELGAVIDRAAILGDGKSLEVSAALGFSGVQPPRTAPLEREAAAPPNGGIAPLSEAMRQHIEAALHATRGTIEGPRGTAALLGINPHTLRARMRKLGIDWSRFRGPGD
jgi:transcriptional regulator with GAF, ATPase, and Fis domain